MLNNKGMTLIESVFAFEIFITVLVLFASLFGTIYKSHSSLNQMYTTLNSKEMSLSKQEDFTSAIDQVLH